VIRRLAAIGGLLVVLACAGAGCGGGTGKLTELQRVRSGALDVVVLSTHEALQHPKDDFIVEFRSAGGTLVDVGDVRATATMPMAGVPMMGGITIRRTDVPGRYRALGEFSMAGTWRMGIEFDGPAGKGSVTFAGAVQ
jgi:hypothetical protein